jgi:hypothetical protein
MSRNTLVNAKVSVKPRLITLPRGVIRAPGQGAALYRTVVPLDRPQWPNMANPHGGAAGLPPCTRRRVGHTHRPGRGVGPVGASAGVEAGKDGPDGGDTFRCQWR